MSYTAESLTLFAYHKLLPLAAKAGHIIFVPSVIHCLFHPRADQKPARCDTEKKLGAKLQDAPDPAQRENRGNLNSSTYAYYLHCMLRSSSQEDSDVHYLYPVLPRFSSTPVTHLRLGLIVLVSEALLSLTLPTVPNYALPNVVTGVGLWRGGLVFS